MYYMTNTVYRIIKDNRDLASKKYYTYYTIPTLYAV